MERINIALLLLLSSRSKENKVKWKLVKILHVELNRQPRNKHQTEIFFEDDQNNQRKGITSLLWWSETKHNAKIQ